MDDIDQCILFRAVRKNNINSKDEYVAIWHDDLKELTDKRCIDGVRLITEYQLKLKEWKEVQGLFYKNKYGVMVPSNISKPEFDSEYDYEEPFIPSVGEGGIKVTKAGFDSLQETLCSLFETIHLKFLRCVEPLIEIGRYDTAVREGCLLLECSIKEEIKSDKFGLMLVDEYCDFLIDKNYLGSFVKPFRQELKNAFRYVRNDYMHNIKQIERDESKAILARVARLYQFVLNEN